MGKPVRRSCHDIVEKKFTISLLRLYKELYFLGGIVMHFQKVDTPKKSL